MTDQSSPRSIALDSKTFKDSFLFIFNCGSNFLVLLNLQHASPYPFVATAESDTDR